MFRELNKKNDIVDDKTLVYHCINFNTNSLYALFKICKLEPFIKKNDVCSTFENS